MEESVKDGKEGCLFELDSVHYSWAPKTLRYTHTCKYIHCSLVTFKKTPLIAALFNKLNLPRCFFQPTQPNVLFLQEVMTWRSLISWESPAKMRIFALNYCCGATLTNVNTERNYCGFTPCNNHPSFGSGCPKLKQMDSFKPLWLIHT